MLRLTRLPLLTRLRQSDPRLPGPVGLPVIGVAPQFMRDPFTYMLECQRRYGDIFRLPLPLWDLVVTTHPDLAVEVFHDRDAERFGFPEMPEAIARLIGTPLLAFNGDQYAERRRALTPMFSKRYLVGQADIVVDEYAMRLRAWDRFAQTGEVVDLSREMARITLPTSMRTLFSMSVTGKALEQYDTDLRLLLSVPLSVVWMKPPPNLLPIPGIPSAAVSALRLRNAVSRIVADRRAHPIEGTDLLQELLNARLHDGSPIPPKEVIWNVIGIMAAGYETVVSAMSWMLALLPTNGKAEQRLFDEIDALGGRVPGPADADRLAWWRACFDEGQRLQGHPFDFRLATADTELAGFHIAKGTFVAASFTALHRDPRWWANPERFDPDHFADTEQVAARPKAAFIPFGTGTHICPGMTMAYMNAMFLTALIFQRYRIHLLPGWEPRHDATGSTSIKGGLPVTLTRR